LAEPCMGHEDAAHGLIGGHRRVGARAGCTEVVDRQLQGPAGVLAILERQGSRWPGVPGWGSAPYCCVGGS
jgi:hypothetical protein